jgi:integrase
MSVLTVGQWWEERYKPYIQRTKKAATQSQYESLWTRWLNPILGRMRLFQVQPSDIERAISAALTAKKSASTANHIRKVASAIFTHAKRQQAFSGDNPAQCTEPMEARPVRKIKALNPEECRDLLNHLHDPARAMALMAITMSCNVSELLGLQEQHVNLSDQMRTLEGADTAPAHWAAIRDHVYHGKRGSLKTGKRRRNLPMPATVEAALRSLIAGNKSHGPDAPIFQTSTGNVQHADNLRKRDLQKAVAEITKERRAVDPTANFPRVDWHVLRHTHATLSKSVEMSDYDRMRLMGHGSIGMTDRYTHEDLVRLSEGVAKVAALLESPAMVDDGKVVSIRQAKGQDAVHGGVHEV